MFVIKRNGEDELFDFSKIEKRILFQFNQIENEYNIPDEKWKTLPNNIFDKIKNSIINKMCTTEIDELIMNIYSSLITKEYVYNILAARICTSKIHKETFSKFSESMKEMNKISNHKYIKSPYIDFIEKYADVLDAAIMDQNDYTYDYLAIRTIERGYLLKINDKIRERPQHMLMRIAVYVRDNIDEVLKVYQDLSHKLYTHASPVLFYASTFRDSVASCTLLNIEDNFDSIYNNLKKCAIISASGSGIGLTLSAIRASNTYHNANMERSPGLVPLIRMYNASSFYVSQNANRPNPMAVYLEPWHGDIFEFLDLRSISGSEDAKARELFYGLWIPDLFMKRVDEDGMWSLMCPHKCPGLNTSWGEDFEKLYIKYENEKKYIKQVPARALMTKIISTQIETGMPYMLYKDACNKKNNQQNLGVLQTSNLCTEILQYTSSDEIAVCNLASVCINKFIKKTKYGIEYDYTSLYLAVREVVKNINKIIDITKYPVESAKRSNFRHRPMGIGVQGLADLFIEFDIPFVSEKAKELNRYIFETIYFAAMTESNNLAKLHGTYESYPGSPTSKGLLQYDLWDVQPSCLWDWKTLKENIKKDGLRNSLTVTVMPTAGTAQILSNNESCEPFHAMMFTKRITTGSFQVVNRYLYKDLNKLNLWNDEIKNKILENRGKIGTIKEIPINIRNKYKTVWEILQKDIIDLTADRAPFIDQSQSLNIWLNTENPTLVYNVHMYAWKKGLKTGMYYLRGQPASNAISITVEKKVDETKKNEQNVNEVCLVCSS